MPRNSSSGPLKGREKRKNPLPRLVLGKIISEVLSSTSPEELSRTYDGGSLGCDAIFESPRIWYGKSRSDEAVTGACLERVIQREMCHENTILDTRRGFWLKEFSPSGVDDDKRFSCINTILNLPPLQSIKKHDLFKNWFWWISIQLIWWYTLFQSLPSVRISF